jgi:hypothetical protein
MALEQELRITIDQLIIATHEQSLQCKRLTMGELFFSQTEFTKVEANLIQMVTLCNQNKC